jgi:sodium/potassium/calcium exchanger 6
MTPLNHGPRRGMILFAIFGFLLSIMWIWFIANILIDLLGVLGLILGFKPAFLGITLLAWGNSVGDMMTNSAVAKKGLARMALTGCFAGPLFNFLIGLGLSLAIKAINGQPPEKFEITDKEAILPMMAVGALLVQLIMIIIIAIVSKFHLKKVQGVIQMCYFVLVIAAISTAAFTFAK